LREVPDADPRAPATEYEYTDGGGRVGVIASVSKPFCLNCNRLRLTSEGKIRYCLFAIEESDVRPLLRSAAPDERIAAVIRANIAGKWIGHQINSPKFVAPPRPMYSIGG
jgi:cyclic pyranopterin phosphate synthase